MRVKLFFAMILLLLATTAALAQTGDDVKPLPEVGKGQPHIKPGTVERTMYMYVNGVKTPLEQDLNFVALKFAKSPISKDERHAFYKKIRLVVSELHEPQLLSEGYFVLRLMPGASLKQWQLFVGQMRQSPELSYVGRVFKRQSGEGLKDLFITTPGVIVRFKPGTDEGTMKRLVLQYPLVADEIKPEANWASYTLRDLSLDTVDLANRLFETGAYASVEPLFITVKGQSITPEKAQQVIEGAIRTMPEKEREKMERRIRQQQQQQGQQPQQPQPPQQSTPQQ